MNIKLFITGVMAASTIVANAQNEMVADDCRCEESFEWLRPTFETNDAGFGYIVERKGRTAYDLHNQMTLEKVRAASTYAECNTLLGEWLRFFRRGHIGIELLIPDPAPAVQNAAQTTEPEMWQGDIAAFEKEIATLQDASYEGIWEHTAGVYKMGLKVEGNGYTGFITESNLDDLKPGEVLVKITRDGERWRTTHYYNGAVSSVADGKPDLLGKTHLILGGQLLGRVSPALSDISVDPWIEGYVKAFSTWTPYIEQLNPTTLYMRIPSFDTNQRSAIEKMIADNFNELTSTENLIIDVRGNGGGGDGSWSELFRLLYTNPVRVQSVSFLSTPLNIDNISERLNAVIGERLMAHPGEFVPLSEWQVDIATMDTVCKYPRSVGVIVDGSCASSTEQFLLAARQSMKVKLFGVATFGALDVSNMLTVDSPDGRYRLRYASSRSMRIPGMEIDGIGIQPDFYLDKTIPDHKWVEHVSDMLNSAANEE